MIKKVFHNIVYAPFRVIKETFVALGVILGLYQGIVFFFPQIAAKTIGWNPFLMLIIVSLIYGRCRTWKPAKVAFIIPNTNTTIEVLFGDLFAQNGLQVIPVNDFFDSKIGKPVSNKTLHGILIEKHLQGHTFDELISDQLSNIDKKIVAEKTNGKNECYPIGTTVAINADNNYLVFAFSRTNPTTYKAQCDVAIMCKALEGLWKMGRIESGGNPINIPLVGSGQSGVGLPARDLLNIIILSIIAEAQKERISAKIRIILQCSYFEELDLRDLKQYWKE
jgi:hypothetical protein